MMKYFSGAIPVTVVERAVPRNSRRKNRSAFGVFTLKRVYKSLDIRWRKLRWLRSRYPKLVDRLGKKLDVPVGSVYWYYFAGERPSRWFDQIVNRLR